MLMDALRRKRCGPGAVVRPVRCTPTHAGWLALCCAVVALAGCGRKTAAPPAATVPVWDATAFDGQRALDEVRRLVALGPRDAGTPGAARAADYLQGRLRELGVEATVAAFHDAAPGGAVIFRNVLGKLPGAGGGLIILGSHYDTKAGLGPDFQGANDGGSSTGVLLEIARVAAGPWRDAVRRARRQAALTLPEIWLVFFDGEECRVRYGPHDGFHGSRQLARQLVTDGRAREVLAMVLLDMVGQRDVRLTLPHNVTPDLAVKVLNAAAREGVREKIALLADSVGDDHVAFIDAGMPAVDLIDFQYGSAPGLNDYWHTAADRLDKLSPASLQLAGRVTLRLVGDLVAETAGPR
ncbi:MAG: M28 family peptidase [Kiritimatiellaeota bacterium]|nr:M28 family peptidase [Kiritimatiellota bacterium]